MNRSQFRSSLILIALLLCFFSNAQTWIWFPGDYEYWLGNQMNNRRTERNVQVPVQWKLDAHEPLMIFTKSVNLDAPEEIEVYAEGDYVINIGWRIKYDGNPSGPTRISVPAGEHILKVKVINYANVPAIYVQGKSINSDGSWNASPLDPRFVTQDMRHPDSPSGILLPAGSADFNDPSVLPSEFMLPTRPISYASKEEINDGILYDFGRETFGFIKFHQLQGSGNIRIQYGESREEALDPDNCETFFEFEAPETSTDLIPDDSKALRFAFINGEGASYDDISLLYEYAPVKYRASFECNDEQINKIWEVGRYTLELTTREVFIDGIKRDRWAWSGDAYQSYLMNYYMFFDLETTRRTMYTLRGNNPVMCHLNNIMDYTFYWFLGIYDYYLYTGDKEFLRLIYPKMESLMDFVLERRNERGLVEGLRGDWVYIDWLDHEADKSGEVSFEQILFCKSLETMALTAQVLDIESEATRYNSLAQDVRSKLSDFWDEKRQAMVFNRKEGINSELITKHANMFAIFFNYLSDGQKQAVKKSVILNEDIPAISTPYMRFYELEAMCSVGEQPFVLDEIKSYWGGMIDLGATTFWEKYNPEQEGLEHYAMYGRPFGKSLCHAWGASPIYLLGKYFVGVKPTAPGYEEFEIRPVLGGLEWFESTIPTPNGEIKVYASKSEISVSASEGAGYLIFSSDEEPSSSIGQIDRVTENEYILRIAGDGKEVKVTYSNIE